MEKIIQCADVTFVCQFSEKLDQLTLIATENCITGRKYVGCVPSTVYEGKKIINNNAILYQMIQDGFDSINNVYVKYTVDNYDITLRISFQNPYLTEEVEVKLPTNAKSSEEKIAELVELVENLD